MPKTRKEKAEYSRYYMRIYRANPEQRESYTALLNDCLKLNFENTRIEKQILSEKVPIAPEPVLSLTVSAKSFNDLPKISLEEYEEVEELVPFYRVIAEDFYHKYRSQVDYKQVERYVRHYQPYSLKELKQAKKELQKAKESLILAHIIKESDKASETLRKAFPMESFASFYDSKEKSEQLYFSAMLKLKAEGFGYFESDLASARLSYPLAFDTGSRYAFQHIEPTVYKEVLERLKVHDNPDLVEWRMREKDDIEVKERIWLKRQQEIKAKQEKEARWTRKMTEWLTHFIEYDGHVEELAQELQRAGYSAERREKTRKLYEQLKKTVKRKQIRPRIKEDNQE